MSHFLELNFLILFILLIIIFSISCDQYPKRSKDNTNVNNNNYIRYKKNSHLIIKKLEPIEIFENIPIGYIVVDLKSSLLDTNKYNDDYYFSFEFIEDESTKKHDDFNLIGGGEDDSSPHFIFSLSSYFLLDSYTGTIKTSRSLDLENFCDLNLCQKYLSDDTLNYSFLELKKFKCIIPFVVKATKHVYTNLTMNKYSISTSQNNNDLVYHIVFDLVLNDVNEFQPEFEQNKAFYFNVSEEFAPIKLALGSVAYDNDCSDRGPLNYMVSILKINNEPLDEFIKTRPKYQNYSGQGLNILDLQAVTDADHNLLFLYTRKPLDRELIQSLDLDIIASDRSFSSDERFSSILKVFINVTDLNDNAPRFETSVYNLEFDEGLEKNSELIKLKASDPDYGLNGEIRYDFAFFNEDIKETFTIDPFTGSLTLKKKLDFSKKNYWQLSIKAYDLSQSENSKSSIAIVNIRVNDINNHEPDINVNFFVVQNVIEPRILTRKEINKDLLTKEEVVYVSKRIPSDTAIGLITIIDKDADWNGYIQNITLNLKQDGRLPIYLQDFYDQIEKYKEDESGELFFSSNMNLNTEIELLLKSDIKKFNLADSKATNKKKYLIRINDELNKINNKNKKLNSFEIELKASDKGYGRILTGSKQFKLIVINANNLIRFDYSDDNDENEMDSYGIDEEIYEISEWDEPIQYSFGKSTYEVYLNANNTFPIELAKVNASDLDMNSAVRYEILMPSFPPISNHEKQNTKLTKFINKRNKLINCSIGLYNHLSIDSYNGIIMLNKSLYKNENKQQPPCLSYLYQIRATDLIENRLSSTLNFKIHVTGLNVHSGPKFKQKNYIFHIAEQTMANASNIIKLDYSNLSPNLVFKLERYYESNKHDMNDLDNYFSILKDINDQSVKLVIKKPLDSKKHKKIVFKLVVSDADNDAESDFALVEVNVLDGNDFRPVHSKIVPLIISENEESFNALRINRLGNSNNFFVIVNLDLVYNLVKNDVKIKFENIGEIYIDLIRIYSEEFYDENTKPTFLIKNIGFNDLTRIKKNRRHLSKASNNGLEVLHKQLSFKPKHKDTIGTSSINIEASWITSGSDTLNLFGLNQTSGYLRLDLSRFQTIKSYNNNLKKKILRLPLMALITIEMGFKNSETNQFMSNQVNLIMLLVNNSIIESNMINFNEIRTFFAARFSTSDLNLNSLFNRSSEKTEEQIQTTILNNKMNKSYKGYDFQTLKEALMKLKLPSVLVISIMLLIVITALFLLFISIKYSISLCKVVKCELVNKSKKNDAIHNKKQAQFKSLIETGRKLEDEKIYRNQIGSNLRSFLPEVKNDICCLDPNMGNHTNNKYECIKDKVDYLFDSPILIRKLYENNDIETKTKYIKKYHLEYFFDESENSTNYMVKKLTSNTINYNNLNEESLTSTSNDSKRNFNANICNSVPKKTECVRFNDEISYKNDDTMSSNNTSSISSENSLFMEKLNSNKRALIYNKKKINRHTYLPRSNKNHEQCESLNDDSLTDLAVCSSQLSEKDDDCIKDDDNIIPKQKNSTAITTFRYNKKCSPNNVPIIMPNVKNCHQHLKMDTMESILNFKPSSKQKNISYQKSPILPEDNIWILKKD